MRLLVVLLVHPHSVSQPDAKPSVGELVNTMSSKAHFQKRPTLEPLRPHTAFPVGNRHTAVFLPVPWSKHAMPRSVDLEGGCMYFRRQTDA
ncbi:hypothetical protein IWX47DRAFT_862965 [Phyllosticta citricarpa]